MCIRDSSQFGLIEMTRQRIRPSLRRSIYEDCPSCNGAGQVKTAESLSIEVMRLTMSSAIGEDVHHIVIEVHERVANHLNNQKRKEIAQLEEDRGVEIRIHARADVVPEHLEVRCEDENNRSVQIPATSVQKARSGSKSR